MNVVELSRQSNLREPMENYNLHNSADMEKCKGDQPPEKNLIGPSLPLSEALYLDRQPDSSRPAMGGSAMSGSQLLSLPHQAFGSGTNTGRSRRSNIDPCWDFGAQFKGCFEAPVLGTDFVFEEPISVNDSPVKKVEAERQKSYEESVLHLPIVEENHHLPTVSLETPAQVGSTSPLHVAPLGPPDGPSLQERDRYENLSKVSHRSGDIQTCEQIASCVQASDAFVMKSSPRPDTDLRLDNCDGGDDGLSTPFGKSPLPASYQDPLVIPAWFDLSLDRERDSSPASVSFSPPQQHVLDEGEQETLWSKACCVSIFEPRFCSEDVAQRQSSQAPDDTAAPCSAQPSSPQPIAVTDIDQIHVQVNVVAAGVKETVVMETEAEEVCKGRMDSEPLESWCLLVTDQPGERAGEREEERREKSQDQNSTGCCFFSCFSSKLSKE